MATESFHRNQGKGLLIGLAGGAFGGLIGLGGGIIMIPLMALLAGLTQHQAHGTSLLAIVFTGLIGAVTYAFHGFADWRAALVLAVSAMVTARFGALYAHSLPERQLKKAFGWFLIVISFSLVFKGLILQSSYAVGPLLYYVTLIGTGAFTGFLSGMMGVGGGGIMVPFLVIFIGMPQHLAQGTSLLAMTPGSAVGAFTHYRLGNIAKRLGLGLVLGGAIGGYIGASLAHFVPEFHLKVIFALVGLWMGIRYIKAA
jgi:uncharacterized membrane protein YfcA